jgi:hypothetical protein
MVNWLTVQTGVSFADQGEPVGRKGRGRVCVSQARPPFRVWGQKGDSHCLTEAKQWLSCRQMFWGTGWRQGRESASLDTDRHKPHTPQAMRGNHISLPKSAP